MGWKRGRGREDEERRREEEGGAKKVWKLTLSTKILKFCMDFYDFLYGFYMESKELMVLYGFLGIFMSSKPRV